MEKLEILRIKVCNAFVEFPEIEANMDNLVKLSLYQVGIENLPSTIGEYCTNLSSLKLKDCSKLKSIGCHQFEKMTKDLFNENLDGLGLRKLDLSWCELEDGEIPNEVGQLSSLQELHLRGNCFTRLDFSLSRLTSLKLLDVSDCHSLIELPDELPSRLAILKADRCISLEVIKDDAHRSCKWLCEVSIRGGRNNISGGERLLEAMLQGMAVESRCMALELSGSKIPRVFEPDVVRRGRCRRMQLPDNWYIHFSGFLFCATSHGSYNLSCPVISMKHADEKSSVGDSQDDDDDVYWEEETVDYVYSTRVMYLPFSLLRNTSWWDPTSPAIEVEFYSNSVPFFSKTIKCGLKLVPKGGDAECSSSSETTLTTHSSGSSDDHDDVKYKCKFDIVHDSKSDLKFRLG